jgi:VanZ family protein
MIVGHEQTARGMQLARIGSLLAAWAPVMLWMGVIFWLSGDQFSDEHTAAWLTRIPLLEVLGLSPASIDLVNLIVRKSAHFVEYAILSMLVYRAIGISAPGMAARRVLLVTACLAIAIGGVDELRQTATQTRTGSSRDVAIDSVGALAGALSGAGIVYRFGPRRPTRE